MKRIGTLAFYVVGTLAIIYIALYAYAVYRGRHFVPGDPIHIFRNPDAPNYSQDDFFVIARSDSDEAIQTASADTFWIASRSLSPGGGIGRPPSAYSLSLLRNMRIESAHSFESRRQPEDTGGTLIWPWEAPLATISL